MTRKMPARVPGLTPSHPPVFAPDEAVVVRGYPEGRRWIIRDAEPVLPRIQGTRKSRSKKPIWMYKITSTREDGSIASQLIYEWRLLPASDATQSAPEADGPSLDAQSSA